MRYLDKVRSRSCTHQFGINGVVIDVYFNHFKVGRDRLIEYPACTQYTNGDDEKSLEMDD